MEESKSPSFERPSALEKVASKFILDAFNELEAATPEPKTVTTAARENESESEPLVETCDQPLPSDKKYFRIREVSAIVGVEPYVLRYWESEFKIIKPVKSGSGHRVYAAKDVENLRTIRRLLHEEKYSIEGARKKIRETKDRKEKPTVSSPAILKNLAQELKDLIQAAKHSPGTF